MYANLKAEFNDYKKTLRRSINEAKQLYYKRTFELYRNDIKQTWSVIKHTLQKNVRCPDSAFRRPGSILIAIHVCLNSQIIN